MLLVRRAGGASFFCPDRFGISWQIVPEALPRMMKDKDPAKSKRVMEAMIQMVKLDVGKLERAYEGAA
jgi:predicted 3-demethylubiquinone-9 3-methyltransferase (glyoxalase superfamily)